MTPEEQQELFRKRQEAINKLVDETSVNREWIKHLLTEHNWDMDAVRLSIGKKSAATAKLVENAPKAPVNNGGNPPVSLKEQIAEASPKKIKTVNKTEAITLIMEESSKIYEKSNEDIARILEGIFGTDPKSPYYGSKFNISESVKA